MIIAQRKPLAEILEMIAPYKKVLVLGCGTCVTVCFAGGEKEAKMLASELRMARQMAGAPLEADDYTIQRQCEWEYIDPIAEMCKGYEAVISLACGIGVQGMSERFAEAVILPGVNSAFDGMPVAPGIFAERCQLCGDCILDETAGVCPVSRCAKSLMNGPCGGSQRGKCEVNQEIDCAWHQIYDRMLARGQLDKLTQVRPAKDWRTSRDGGQRKIVREDLRL